MTHISTDGSPDPRLPLVQPASPPDLRRPGWPEIVAGLLGLAAVVLGVGSGIKRLDLDPVARGLVLTALAGIGGVVGFAAALAVRIRALAAFGVRRTTGRWILIAVGAGVAAFVLKSLAILAWIQIFGADANVQSPYAAGGSGGVASLVLATAFLTLLTPLGEELIFRGVLTNALLRHGPVVGVVGSSLVFAATHGFSAVFPTALVVGLVTAEIFRRSGSVWPAVVVHAVHNLPTVPAMVLAGG